MVLVCLMLHSAIAIQLNCNYVAGEFSEVLSKDFLSCDAKNLIAISPYETVQGLIGNNSSHDNVRGLLIRHQTIYFFPSGFEDVLENLLAIGVLFTDLIRITKNDLKPFPQLKGIWLNNNRLTVIERDLFQYNPQLLIVNFHENKLLHVDSNVFSSLSVLKEVYLDRNLCIDHRVTSKERMHELKVRLENCQNAELIRQHEAVSDKKCTSNIAKIDERIL